MYIDYYFYLVAAKGVEPIYLFYRCFVLSEVRIASSATQPYQKNEDNYTQSMFLVKIKSSNLFQLRNNISHFHLLEFQTKRSGSRTAKCHDLIWNKCGNLICHRMQIWRKNRM